MDTIVLNKASYLCVGKTFMYYTIMKGVLADESDF